MPPKRDPGGTPAHPPVKMIKIGAHVQEFGCDPAEEKYGLPEESNYSPLTNQEQHESLDFDEENIGSSGIRTDTISLLMKIEQLQAQLKYERRCRILAERELRELKEMNTLMMQMRHTAHELRVTLDHVLQGEEASAAPPNSDEGVSFLADAEMGASHNIPEDDLDFLYLAENLRVPKKLYERIAEIADYKKYTSALLMILFDRETLATHSLQGRRNAFTGEDCHKPQLPPEILKSIIDHVTAKFGVDNSQIKTAIRTKLNNEDKLLKKRLGLSKSEPKTSMDQSFCHDAALLPENGSMTSDSHL